VNEGSVLVMYVHTSWSCLGMLTAWGRPAKFRVEITDLPNEVYANFPQENGIKFPSETFY